MTATTAPRFGSVPLVRLLLVTAMLVGAVLTVLSGTASAHAALVSSTPGDGTVVATAPKEVTLTFSEQVSLSKNGIRVLDPAGKRADQATIRNLSTANTARYGIDLHAGLPDGTYTVAWQAISADSHPVAGAFTFSIGAPSKTTATVGHQDVGGGLVGFLYNTARYASYAGFILLVGGAAFVLGCWKDGASARPLQRLVVRGWVTLTGATLVLLLLRTPYTGSGKLTDAFDLGGLRDVLGTKEGAALISRLLLLGAASLFIAVLFGAYAKRRQPGSGPGTDRSGQKDLTFGLSLGGGVLAAGIAATWALSEHASTGIQTGLAIPLDVLHLLAVATWLGGLSALLVSLYRVPSLSDTAVRRFSRAAFVSVLVLVATGLYQAWRQVGSWSALGGTAYGQLLIVKVGLVAVMVTIAWFSRRWTARLGLQDNGPAEQTAAAGELTSGEVNTAAGRLTSGERTTPAEKLTHAEQAPEAEAARTEAARAEPAPEAQEAVEADDVPRAAEAALVGQRATEAGASAGRPHEPVGATRKSVGAPGEPAGGDTRAAQLARQQAAVATARQKRVRDGDPVRSGLRRSVLAEACVAVALLAITTVLTTSEPGRTAEEVASQSNSGAVPFVPAHPISLSLPFNTGGINGKGTVDLEVDPGGTGSNVMHLYLYGPGGKPMDVPEVDASFTLKAKQIGPLPVKLQHFAAGHWAAEGIQITMPGEWLIQVSVRTSDIDETTLYKNVKIG